ncbi:MAG: hypothetical protein FJY37_00765 [Betaproteobacteria bacterium]|nr:hypothetical protein [Betaproteobacteria bacterium]
MRKCCKASPTFIKSVRCVSSKSRSCRHASHAVNASRLTSGANVNPTMNAQTVTLTPADNGGTVGWTCAIATDTTRYKYVPANCRN